MRIAEPPKKVPQRHEPPSSYKDRLLGECHKCWVCQRLLSEYGGDASLQQHYHHIIPRAFGGEDGPIIALDSGHHSLLHDVGLRLISGSDYSDLLQGVPTEWQERILYLSSRVLIAYNYSKDDPNKRIGVSLSLTKKTNDKLKQLAEFHGRSKEQYLVGLIEAEHSRLFPSKKR